MSKTGFVSTVAARFAGEHETRVDLVWETVQVLIPGLVVTLADSEAVRCWWRAWRRAADIAPETFNGRDAKPYRATPNVQILTAVTVTGWQSGSQVYGRDPMESPSGCGELRVRVGNVAIICDDRTAFDRQLVTWAMAYDTARRILWPHLGPL